MKFSAAAITAALVAGASANYNMTASVVYTTEVVTAYTTYCPAPTSLVHGNSTYVITTPGTITVTNCPCTVTKPVYTTDVPVTPTAAPVPGSSSSAAPVYPTVSPSSPVYVNSTGAPGAPTTTVPVGTAPVGTGYATSTPPASSATSSSAPISTGAAAGLTALSGAGLAGIFGVAAYLL